LKSKLVILLAVLAAGLLAWAVPGNGAPRAAATKPQKVWVQDNFFDRRSIQIAPNEKVVWVWKGMNRHNVRFTKVPKGAQRGGSKTKTGGRWRRVFKVEGTYRYICKLYTGMRGTITVKAPPPAESKSTAAILPSQ
jgi:plastocyanin